MKDDESISNGFIIFGLKSEKGGKYMRRNGYHLASGNIIEVEEMRFRLFTDGGKGLLLTLDHNAPVDIDELKRWHELNVRVVVTFKGEPNYESAVVRSIEPA